MSGGAAMKPGVTERQAAVLGAIEDAVAAGQPSPNTVELARMTGYSTGEIARILDALEYMGFITRILGRSRNIRLCSPSVRMAPDEHFVAELTLFALGRGWLVRKGTA